MATIMEIMEGIPHGGCNWSGCKECFPRGGDVTFASMGDEWTVELYCKTHKCTAQAKEGLDVFTWNLAHDLFWVNVKAILCPKEDEWSGVTCHFMLLTDSNRYLHGPHC